MTYNEVLGKVQILNADIKALKNDLVREITESIQLDNVDKLRLLSLLDPWDKLPYIVHPVDEMVKRIAIAKLPESIKFEPYSASNIFNDEYMERYTEYNIVDQLLDAISGVDTRVEHWRLIPVKIGSYYHSDYSPGGVKKFSMDLLATAGELVDEIYRFVVDRKCTRYVFDW